MSKNKNLHTAKAAKRDEYYTMLSDIENEIRHYKDHFKDKIVFCNCDDAEYSNFWRYFNDNFEFLGLKKLIATAYHAENQMYKNEIIRGEDGKVINEMNPNFRTSNEGSYWLPIKTPLEQNGDFRSPESIALLEECDIVVTNPPFSLAVEFVSMLERFSKKFIVIGNSNMVTVKNVFALIKENKLWLGNDCRRDKKYYVPEHYPNAKLNESEGRWVATSPTFWYTNLDFPKRHEEILLWAEYNPEIYLKYDNYDAIECVVSTIKPDGTKSESKTTVIPKDYNGEMGVATTFLDKLCPEQFELIGIDRYLNKELTGKGTRMFINGKELYPRLIVKRR